MNSVLERIKQITEKESITITSLEKKIGASKGVLSRAIANSTDIQSKWLIKIVENYPLYNTEWLLTGQGSMLKNEEKENGIRVEQSFSLRTDHSLEIQSIPLYDSEIAAGLVKLFTDKPLSVPIQYIQIPNLPKSDGAIYVSGDSMYPVLKSHDIVIYKEVKDLNSHIFIYGEMYIVSFDNDGDDYTLVKWIQKSELGAEYIKLVSENKHHDSIDIPKNKIRALALIKASIRVNSTQ